MKSLLLKDYYTLKKNLGVVLLFMLGFCCLMSDDLVTVYCAFYAAMLPVTAIAYDERANWNSLAVSMPYSFRDLALGKYLLGYLLMPPVILVSYVAKLLSHYVFHRPAVSFSPLPIMMAVCGAAIVLAFILPIIFRFGSEKARLVYLFIVMIVAAAAVLFMRPLPFNVSMPAWSSLSVLTAILAAAAVVLNLISIRISTAMLKRRFR